MSESKETADWHDEFDRTAKNLFRLVSQRETIWLEMKFQNEKVIAALKYLVTAAKPFLSDKVIVETTGTLPLLDALANSIDYAETLILQVRK